MRYRVGALVTGTIYDEFEADSDKHGDESVYLCSSCEEKVSGLAVSEDTDSYEVEEIGVSI